MLIGNIVDISVFRYTCWQPLEHIDPSQKFPTIKWEKGRFIGIAWDHGDPFTYLVWTGPDEGGWEKGQELTHNVVRPRKET
eukprot:9293426-Ditylum_brightwellii.AAC.1